VRVKLSTRALKTIRKVCGSLPQLLFLLKLPSYLTMHDLSIVLPCTV
jgi:hypothetical protein